jgi:hypothetical protein
MYQANVKYPGSLCAVAGRLVLLRGHLHFLEKLVHELNCHRAFPDRRSDTLDGPGTYVARGEYSTPAGFK